ncbi:hypothetical protein D3C81_1440340 [compost metagenome]
MPKPLHLHLAGVREGAGIHQLAGTVEIVLLVGTTNLMLQLVADIEMVFQRPLAAPGDDRHVLQAGIPCFLNTVLDQRLVDDRQHFLRHRLGGGQKARAIAGSRE